MKKSLLSLFDVLTEEYKHQVVEQKFDENTEKQFEQKRVGHAARFSHLEEEERRKKVDEALVADFYQWLHKHGDKRAAICFSGGGIRSATFALGVLQGLAQSGIKLGQFHFLSTVSGGGYIGSWLSAWIHRQGMGRVQNGLAGESEEEPEPETIRHLRSYSRYMSPSFSLLSADTWSLVGIYLRNLLLNWSVLIPLILGGLAIPRLAMSLVAWESPPQWLPGAALLASLLLGGWATGYIIINRPSLSGQLTGRRGVASPYRRESWFLVLCLLPLWLSAIAASGFWAWSLNLNDGVSTNVASIAASGLSWWTGQPWFPTWLLGWPTLLYFASFGALFHLMGFAFSRLWVRDIGKLDLAYSVITGFVGGACLYLMTTSFFSSPIKGSASAPTAAALFTCFAAPVFLLTFLLAGTLYVGFASYITSDSDREWLARAGGWMLIAIVVWGAVSALVILAPQALLSENDYWGTKMKSLLTSLGVGSGLFTIFGGKSDETAAKKNGDSKKKEDKTLMAMSAEIGLALAAPLFAAFILTTVSLLSTLGIAVLCSNLSLIASSGHWWRVFFQLGTESKAFFSGLNSGSLWQHLFGDGMLFHWQVLFHTPSRTVVWATLAVVGVGVLMGFFVNINGFSLHAAYRDRLVRAYLGASRSSRERSPNPFTGLDEHDNLQIHELTTDLYYSSSFKPGRLLALTGKLTDNKPDPKSDEISKIIWNRLSDQVRDLLQKYADDDTSQSVRDQLEPAVKQAITNAFNRLLEGPPLPVNPLLKDEEQAEFAQVFTRIKPDFEQLPEISAAIDGSPEELLKQLKRLLINRLILDEVFKDDLISLKDSLGQPRPLHIINVALNLVGGAELAWQDRKAQSFTISPLHAGSFNLGYRRAHEYALNNKAIRRLMSNRPVSAISLGTALAISGAAASPNMGYHSSSVVTFLLALFNVRLGWWLGNPGAAGENEKKDKKFYQMPSPNFAPYSLIAETFGMTDAKHPYVYLSDGGHFENLGLYEMVRRRCHFIVLSDASADGDSSFEDLGGAMRKIQIDMGIPIQFGEGIKICPRVKSELLFTKDGQQGNGAYCAVARIRYSAVDGEGLPRKEQDNMDGWLLYIKPTVYGCEPPDVLNYAKANLTFPHETTGDQMYSESQFESYRALGEHAIKTTVANKNVENLESLFKIFEPDKKSPSNDAFPGIQGDAG